MREILLTSQSLPGFAHLLPEEFQRDLLAGELIGSGMLDDTGLDEIPMAAILCREYNGWMEIVWLAVDPDYQGTGTAEWLLDLRLRSARLKGAVCGVIADLPDGEARPAVERILSSRGFTFTEVERPVYDVAMGSLKDVELLQRPLPERTIVPLGRMKQELRAETIRAVQQDYRPTPLPPHMDWDAYDPERSAVYLYEDVPAGLLLISDGEGSVAMDLLWANYRLAPPSLLAYAAQRALTFLPPETRVVLPVITDVSERLVKKLLPDVLPQKITQARLVFVAAVIEENVFYA